MSKLVAPSAFFCAGVRMVDAQSPVPVVGDRHAATLLADDGRQVFEVFAGLQHPLGSTLARHRIIDDMLRDRFKGQPQRLTVQLGAGLDTRPFRLGSGRWVELGQAPIIERKERLMPAAGSPVPLQRVIADFSVAEITQKLAPFATTERMSVVIEGALMFQDEAVVRGTGELLARLFPNSTLICDLMTLTYFRRHDQELHVAIEKLGEQFRWTPDQPAALFEGLGYRRTAFVSIPLRTAEYRLGPASARAVRWLNAKRRDGYGVYGFKLG
jgi:O-methyltransferase involved in polyketide biosynthesis